jgi:hypothetical protein
MPLPRTGAIKYVAMERDGKNIIIERGAMPLTYIQLKWA